MMPGKVKVTMGDVKRELRRVEDAVRAIEDVLEDRSREIEFEPHKTWKPSPADFIRWDGTEPPPRPMTALCLKAPDQPVLANDVCHWLRFLMHRLEICEGVMSTLGNGAVFDPNRD